MSERFERLLVSPSLFIVLFPDKSLTNQIIVLFLQTLLQSNSLQGVYYLLKWNEYLLWSMKVNVNDWNNGWFPV